MIYLLLVSLFLHFVTFFAITVLYKRQEVQQPYSNAKQIQEMEDMLLSYTTEMKENNEQLIQRLKVEKEKYVKQQEAALDRSETADSTTDTHVESIKPINYYPPLTAAGPKNPYENYQPPLPKEEPPAEAAVTSKHSRVLALKKEGYTEKEIAKKLNIGAGEVELLLKFS